MPRYRVEMRETLSHSIEVEARDWDDAYAEAIAVVGAQSRRPTSRTLPTYRGTALVTLEDITRIDTDQEDSPRLPQAPSSPVVSGL